MRAMKDPKTSFGAWYKNVLARDKAKEDSPPQRPQRAASGAVGSFMSMFRSGGSGSDAAPARGESGTDVESQGLLPSFMSRKPAAPKKEAWCDCGLSATQRFQAFVLCILGGGALMTLAIFLFLPMVLLFPAKFALTFTLGSFLIQTAFAMLRGPATHIKGMCKQDRVLGTIAYVGSMVGTLYAAIIAKSYFLVIIAVCVQVAALLWTSVSYLPRGQAALKIFTKLFLRAARIMCYPCKAMLCRLVKSATSSAPQAS